MEYCFRDKVLYVCALNGTEAGSIIAFKMNTTDPPSVTPGSYYVIQPMWPQFSDSETMIPVTCGSSLKLDSYGNLFFVEANQQQILKIDSSEL